ncbi:MAG: enoyl-CoA hydratase-related protein [Candidatus Phosphoribacter sp.]|nr:enoyl-CoA hydratase/isomerase family protein [Actinomycetales bacterium]
MTDDVQPSAPSVLLTVEGGIATVTLNRPDAMNSLDHATKELLVPTIREVAENPEIRVVVLTGTGRAFCVGQDLKEHIAGLQAGDEGLGVTVQEHYNPVALLLATMDKPVIAALNGVAAGAGASMALSADFRIMVEGGGMNLAFAGIALSCDTGSSFWLPRLVGVAKAKELLLLPRTISAQECLSLGLVTSVVSADEFPGAVASLAGTLAAGPTRAYGAMRRAVAFSAAHDLSEALDFERDRMNETGSTDDHRAAVDAFLAKAKPVYSGR